MAVRRARLVFAVAGVWMLATWWYIWAPLGVNHDSPLSGHNHAGDWKQGGTDGMRWKKLPVRYPVKSLTPLPAAEPEASIPKIQAAQPKEDETAQATRLKRLAAVKASFRHSWAGYKKYAWMRDEVTPITGRNKNPFAGWAATLVDSLDSLWIMGLESEFEEAVKACNDIDFTASMNRDINVFETTIRYLGGFLAAYELSGKKYPSLLTKATEVGELLMSAFDTPNHMPISRWNWRKYVAGEDQQAPRTVLAAEIGSLTMEFSKLSQLTGDLAYHDAAQRISDQMQAGQSETLIPGLWPVVVDASKTPLEFPGNSFTLGGMADSLYEYFPKQYLILGGRLEQPKKMYEKFIDVAKKHLFRRALNPENLPILFSGDARAKDGKKGAEVVTTARAQHLTCFAGGMVGLAAKAFDRPEDMDIAVQLTNGCVWAYETMPTGIGPEIFHFIPCDPDPKKDNCKWSDARWMASLRQEWRPNQETVPDDMIQNIIETRRLPKGIVKLDDPKYILRPEAIESVFLMYRMTGDPSWMEKAWTMFTAIQKYTQTDIAAAALIDISKEVPEQADSMESFWLAETLKYFYLVFSDWDVVNLDQWVLNTEAHPLRRGDAAL